MVGREERTTKFRVVASARGWARRVHTVREKRRVSLTSKILYEKLLKDGGDETRRQRQRQRQ